MKALLYYRASPGFRRILDQRAPDWLEVVVATDRDSYMRDLPGSDVLLHVLEPVTADQIEVAPRLRLIQKLGVGVNTIDLEAASSHGVAVANMPGTNTAAVAEMTIGLMIAALRRIPSLDRATREGAGWMLDSAMVDETGEISGKTVGIIGYGAVGARLKRILEAMEARVVVASRRSIDDPLVTQISIDELIREADIISLHVPLTDQTRQMIGRPQFDAMKPGAVFVNTARGGLVDEAALVAALTNGTLRAAALDVYEGEPVDDASPLLELSNVVLAPHIAWLTPETLERSVEVAYENCRRLRDGEPLVNQIRS